jgi:hypothetical protein
MTSFNRLLFVFMAATLIPGYGIAQQEGIPQQQESDSCILKTFASGDKVNLNGFVSANPHDLMMFVSGCSSPVVVEYPSTLEESKQKGISPLQKDDNFKKMEALLNDRSNKHVTANLFGRLDIAKPVPEGTKNILGLLVNGSGKQVGTYGFGSPAPVYKYRLVLQVVYSVSAGQ